MNFKGWPGSISRNGDKHHERARSVELNIYRLECERIRQGTMTRSVGLPAATAWRTSRSSSLGFCGVEPLIMYLLLYFFAQLFIYIIMKAQKIYIT
jgi:hypothetical protein